jgi:hypothetical protein
VNDNSLADAGLSVFVLIVTVNVISLLVDLFLYAEGATTITYIVCHNERLGWTILLMELVGVLGLAAHFLFRTWP